MEKLTKEELNQANELIAKETVEKLGYSATPRLIKVMAWCIRFFEILANRFLLAKA